MFYNEKIVIPTPFLCVSSNNCGALKSKGEETWLEQLKFYKIYKNSLTQIQGKQNLVQIKGNFEKVQIRISGSLLYNLSTT